MRGTVKQFTDGLEKMRSIYPFDDNKTRLSTFDIGTRNPYNLQISTRDEKTGIMICMEKDIKEEE